jgi:hypothetical protein
MAALAKVSGPTVPAKPDATGETVESGSDLTTCKCGHAFIELCSAEETDSQSASACKCCRCAAKRQVPVNISITICCCCAGDQGGVAGGTGGPGGTGGTGSTGGTGGTGTVGGTGWGPGPPEWGSPDDCGWQLWGEPFTLPVTQSNWPARYTGALDPNTNPDSVVAIRDIAECGDRLGALNLLKGMSSSAQQQNFDQLRAECVRLVQGWPATPNYAVGIDASADGTAAPQLSLQLVSQLQMAAINPYLARVLGLYFVDTQADPGTEYQYCIVGLWANEVPPQVLSPGGAPTGALARGTANFDGMTITADTEVSHLFAWQNDGTTTKLPPEIQGVAAAVTTAFTAATATLTELPAALLGAQLNPPAWPFIPHLANPTVCTIDLNTPVAEVAVSVAGQGSVAAFANGTQIASATFSGTNLVWHPLAAPDPSAAPIDEIRIVATGGPGSTVVIGAVASSPVTGANVGIRYALVNVPAATTNPGPMPAPAEPPQPVTIFRRRAADVDPSTLTIRPSSFFEAQWVWTPLTAAEQQGDPVTDPAALPTPRRAVAYLGQRGDGNLNNPVNVPRMITATPQPTPADSPLLPATAILRFVDSGLPDPAAGYQHRTAGFGIFGQLGAWSEWSDPRGVEHIAAAPSLSVVVGGTTQSSFDNSPAGGGAPDNAANPMEWVGGTLSAVASWTASSLLAYPDARTARLTVSAANNVLTTNDFDVPAPSVRAYILDDLVAGAPNTNIVYAITTPSMTAVADTDPTASLTLTGILADGTAITERFAVRPGSADPSANIPGVVAELRGGLNSRIVTNKDAFRNRPAYLVRGVSVPISLKVPLAVPIADTSASGDAVVGVSTKAAFDPAELIVDPNTGATRTEPQSNTVVFVGAQQLQPPQPPAVAQPVPTHIVHHLYYDPADYNGNAGYTLPFEIALQQGVFGYLLDRAPAHSLFIADVKRRLTAGLLDPNPAIAGRADLQTWIDALPTWLAAYNQRNGESLSPTSVLSNAAGQRAFIQHFYGGLLDEELRALADVAGNAAAFAQLSPQPVQPPQQGPPVVLTDTVTGNGFGRNLYGLRSVNSAGTRSDRTPSVGPIYTRTVRPSRAPVLYKVTATPSSGAFIVAWALDGSPDVAGYLVYRATDPSGLADLRWFGTDLAEPADPSTLALPRLTSGVWQPLSLTAGTGDPRLIGVVNDPRAYARDYEGSDMGEVALPTGTPPDEILGVYRSDEFNPATPNSQSGAFNYWIPGTAGGTAQLITDTTVNPATSRVTGLRLGLGRGVAVVVVASYAGVVRVIGSQPVLRAAFVDGIQPGSATSAPADPNASPSWTAPAAGKSQSYAIVAVDVAGNLSPASAPFTPPALVSV